MARIVAMMVVAALAAMPAAAFGGTAEPGLRPAPDPSLLQNQIGEAAAQQPAPAAPTRTDDGVFGTGELALVGVAVVALMGGVWLAIARDARRAAARRRAQPAGGDPRLSRRSPTRARRARRLSAAERRRRKRSRARR